MVCGDGCSVKRCQARLDTIIRAHQVHSEPLLRLPEGRCSPAALVRENDVDDVRSVSVTVAGQTLRLRTDATDDELRTLVASVNERVQAIRAATKSASTVNIYLLAAMTLADDLRRSRASMRRLEDDVRHIAEHALAELDDDDPPVPRNDG